jgi:iron complex transport system ATP-binding protein
MKQIDNFISFNDVSYTYPAFENEFDNKGTPIVNKPVFDHFTANLPGKFTSLIGPNGSGKSTFMLLASGRIPSEKGSVKLFDKNLATMSETQRNLIASFVYQNMEFESNDKTDILLNTVFENGGWNKKGGACDTSPQKPNSDFVKECIQVFELEKILTHPLNGLSKGEIQRTLLAFSLLYGCKSIFLDEPLFALEKHQKETALSFLRKYSDTYAIPLFISMQELDLTRKYAENVLLFMPNRNISFGPTNEVLTKDDIEKAYGVPLAMMKEAEDANRKNLLEESIVITDFNKQTR